ncbi:MAG: ATP-binding cassette domain-containing protein [Desulfatiglandaceae bacterium]
MIWYRFRESRFQKHMAILNLQDVSIHFGGPPLLDRVTLQVEKGERVCLLGRNGEGKTTLLRLISGKIEPDSGAITLQKGITVAGLSQALPSDLSGSVYDVVAEGLARIGPNPETEPGWGIRRQVEMVLTRLSLDAKVRFETLSVGIRRRVLLARALVAEPDILLLDEPTNHLDIPSIVWIEDFLGKFRGTLIFVTHDRLFTDRLATRIVELDRGRLMSWACGYRTFLERRQASLEAEEAQRGRFNKKLAREEEWVRKGIKARRTRNEGRVRALMKMRAEQQAWRRQGGAARIQIQEAERTGKLVIEAVGITHGYGGNPCIKNFSTKIIRGDRIGIIGPNGIGKSTLLRILLMDMEPNAGRVRTGTRLEVVYFDQLREQLDPDRTVEENVADGKKMIPINGSDRHVIGYLKDFLFAPDRAKSPVRILSGGEKNRLLLARLFARPSNVLVLDEPTNDLDMETLELLEERLLDYSGTILLVSHDREFLNNVVTSTLVFEAGGVVREYAGGYDDWLRQRPRPADPKESAGTGTTAKPKPEKRRGKKDGPRKLTFKEGKELEALPPRIEGLEQEQKGLFQQMADPKFYREEGERISRAQARIDQLGQELKEAYGRWEELESIKEANP